MLPWIPANDCAETGMPYLRHTSRLTTLFAVLSVVAHCWLRNLHSMRHDRLADCNRATLHRQQTSNYWLEGHFTCTCYLPNESSITAPLHIETSQMAWESLNVLHISYHVYVYNTCTTYTIRIPPRQSYVATCSAHLYVVDNTSKLGVQLSCKDSCHD